jgi:NAD(P)H-dependent FMN reductase
MKTLLIIWHSRTGGAMQMAAAAERGARSEDGVRVLVAPAERAGADELIAADGVIFAFPENLAAISGQMKEFFDRSYYPALGRIEGRPYAMMVCAGSDGENAVRQAARIATGWRLRAVAEPIIVCTHAQTPQAILAQKTISAAELRRCEELGQAMAAGLALGIF